jgi:hypothetical protein
LFGCCIECFAFVFPISTLPNPKSQIDMSASGFCLRQANVLHEHATRPGSSQAIRVFLFQFRASAKRKREILVV